MSAKLPPFLELWLRSQCLTASGIAKTALKTQSLQSRAAAAGAGCKWQRQILLTLPAYQLAV